MLKPKARLMLALLPVSTLPTFGGLEFCGFMSDARAIRFVLTDSDTGGRSAWLAIGQSFQGYTIVEFDSKSEVLVLRRNSQTLRLPIRTPQIREAQGAPSPSPITVSIGGQGSISVRDDPSLLSTLEVEFRRAATLTPQPTVTIRASEKAALSVLQDVFELCKSCGLQKISFSTQ